MTKYQIKNNCVFFLLSRPHRARTLCHHTDGDLGHPDHPDLAPVSHGVCQGKHWPITSLSIPSLWLWIIWLIRHRLRRMLTYLPSKCQEMSHLEGNFIIYLDRSDFTLAPKKVSKVATLVGTGTDQRPESFISNNLKFPPFWIIDGERNLNREL